MASYIAYTKQMLVERIRRHVANGWPNNQFSASENEVLLYIDQALASTLIGQVYANAKVDGNLATPEAWLTTYSVTPLKDAITGDWYATLPQPPVNLPLGYSIDRVYAGVSGQGASQEFLPIKAKRVGYRKNMPLPNGARYWVIGDKIWMAMHDGSPLGSYTVYVTMAKTRTDSYTETLNLPDDAIEVIFNNVVGKLVQRMQVPKDIISDELPAGNKSS